MSGEPTTWNKELAAAANGDQIIAKAPSDEAIWDEVFDGGYGGSQGKPILAWSKQYVYFPVTYDGSEWIDRAPRNPQPDGQSHTGGE